MKPTRQFFTQARRQAVLNAWAALRYVKAHPEVRNNLLILSVLRCPALTEALDHCPEAHALIRKLNHQAK